MAETRRPKLVWDADKGDWLSDELYFIADVEANAIKIGRGFDARKRLTGLQVGSCRELSLIDAIPHKGWQEAFWHCCWDTWRIRGEWFEATPELREAIRAIRNPKDGEDWTDHVPPLVSFNCDVGEWREHMLDALDAYSDYALDLNPLMPLDEAARYAIHDPDFDGRCTATRFMDAGGARWG